MSHAHAVARNEAPAARAFPPLTEDPYGLSPDERGLSPGQRAARRVLALAGRKLGRSRRLGWRLGPIDAVTRLLWLHRQAVAAEVRGRWPTADFWWYELRRQWQNLPADHPDWGALAEHLGRDAGALAARPAGLRERLARELLLDTHLAFFNNLTNGDSRSPSFRARRHLDSARELVPDAGLDAEQADDFAVQPDLQRLGVHVDHQEWDKALDIAQTLATRHPTRKEYWALLAHLHRRALEAARAGNHWEVALTHAEWLAREFPDSPGNLRRRGLILWEGFQAYRRDQEWAPAERFADSLARLYPDRPDFQKLPAEVLRAWRDSLAAREAWSEALPVAERLALRRREGTADLDGYVELAFKAALAEIDQSASSEAVSRRQAEQLEGHIQKLEDFFKRVPECWPACDALGALYQLKAVKLANGDRPSQALLAIAQSLAYQPNSEQAREAQAKIEKMLENLQQQVKDLEPRSGLDARHLRTLLLASNPELGAYWEEAENGTRPRNRFLTSQEPERIREARSRARARHFWLRVGLPCSEDGNEWDRRARAFDEATDRLMASKPQSGVELLQRWLEIVEQTPGQGLEDLNSMTVLGFFLKKDGKEEAPAEEELSPPESATDEPPEPEENLPRLDAEGRHVPCLKARIPGREPSGTVAVPFEFWLISRRDLGKKLVTAAALLALAVTGAFAVLDRQARSQRDAAYTDLQKAVAELNEQEASAALNRFRTARPLASQDQRLEGLSRLEEEMSEWPALRQRNAAYQELQAATQRKDDLAVLRAAEKYLEAPPLHRQDPRTARVLDRYAEAFADWMLGQDENPETKARAARYRALALAARGEPQTRP
jgi:hypothetical protein